MQFSGTCIFEFDVEILTGDISEATTAADRDFFSGCEAPRQWIGSGAIYWLLVSEPGKIGAGWNFGYFLVQDGRFRGNGT